MLIYLSGHIVGLASAVLVIMQGTHRARGAVAWVLGLIGIPWIAVPLYWLTGHVRYDDYAAAIDVIDAELDSVLPNEQDGDANAHPVATLDQSRAAGEAQALNRFGIAPTSQGNEADIYRTGSEAFDAIDASIQRASDYVLLQTYLVRDDAIGQKIARSLIDACARGCSVYVLYDELGSRGLSDKYVRALTEAGAQVFAFSLTRRFLPRLRLNFRNHRKLLIVDGETAYLGGLNIGDEYINGGAEFTAWRDTHMRLAGPSVLALQRLFVEDWYFASHDDDNSHLVKALVWQAPAETPEGDCNHVTICGLGPHLRILSGDELFTFLIESAVQRLWIATPYFVPDDRVITSLKTAALRGVNVTVLVPRALDHGIFARVHDAFANELLAYGIELYFYEDGFMHQKVMLVDDKYAAIGSANFDNRSFRLNFEMVAIISAGPAIAEVEAMLREDLSGATAFDPANAHQTWYDSLLANIYRLMAPVL
jgi:cardiolipin synthase